MIYDLRLMIAGELDDLRLNYKSSIINHK